MTDPYRSQPPQPTPVAPVYAPVAVPPTNTLAVVSMIFGIVAFVVLPFIGSLVAVITGHIGLGQIKRTREGGHGMALAGVILGWVGLGLVIIGVVLWIVLVTALFGVAANSGGLNS